MIQAISATGHKPGKAATCTEPQTCESCGAVLELPTGHHYSESVTMPNCASMGYTTFTCNDCGISYVGNYTDKIEHHYYSVITPATCTELGFTTYTCTECGDEYKSDYTDKKPHSYKAVTTPATCTSMGHTTYTCEDCGDSYVSDYTDVLPHNYTKEVIEPTCTEQGYTVYTCHDCGKEYIGDEKESIEHKYISVVTAPTCTELGFTTYVCENCGNEVKSDYIEATGHKPSDWIVDAAATIENSGSKHRECIACGETLETVEIPQLTDKDNSDEDGHSKVGDYFILITDKDGKPIFDSEISIDKNDNITIKLPDGRLLSAEDITTITVMHSETQQPAEGINIFIADTSKNAATGKTDANGQLSVPNKQSSTGDSNGTVADNENTYVVIATDKNGELIPNGDVTVGDNYSINVKLPDGTAFDKDNRITVTVVTEKGEPVKNLRVQLIGDSDYIENGYTNIKGQLTLPMSNTDITDEDGSGEVSDKDGDKVYDYIVTVSDETGLIKDALVTLIAKDNSVLVCLPEGKVIDYFNRTTVKVVRADGTPSAHFAAQKSAYGSPHIFAVPVEGWKVSVYNKDGSGLRTEVTDENGIVIVPPLSEAPISKPTPTPSETDKPSDPTPTPGETEKPSDPTPTPDEPSEPTPTPDLGDGSVVQNKNYKYRVYVWDNDGVITDFGLIKLQDNGDLEIELPSTKTLTADNKVNIKVVNDKDNSAVKGITVNVTDSTGAAASDITNSNGIAVVPVSDSDITDANGNAQVKDDKGNFYNINVEDTKAKIENAYVEIKDGKISVKLPDTNELTTSNQTTVTVMDKDTKPIKDMSVTVTDKNSKTATKSTDVNGKITVPVKSSGGSSGGGSHGGGGGGASTVSNSYNVKVIDKDGKTINVSKSAKDDKITLTLPNGKTLDNNYYTITVTDRNGKVQPDIDVTLKDKNNSANGTTDKNGQLVLPATEHKLYVVGYEDGTFKPEGNMTRSEAAAIFARNIAERKSENISNTKSSFTDVATNLWYNQYISYLEKYDIIEGYDDGTFKPDEHITRAEFVTMCARFYSLFDKITDGKNNKFTDIASSHWAYKFINSATAMDWIKGYADGTFKPDNNITRAEVVAIVNRVTDREADTEYVNKNLSNLNRFSDLTDKGYWAYYPIIEAANTHRVVTNADGETWVK